VVMTLFRAGILIRSVTAIVLRVAAQCAVNAPAIRAKETVC
jgi:hypothetical protein